MKKMFETMKMFIEAGYYKDEEVVKTKANTFYLADVLKDEEYANICLVIDSKFHPPVDSVQEEPVEPEE
jgi:hypothetical protein